MHLTRSCLSAIGLALTLAATSASAATVESRFGALDGLGIGLASGDSFEYGNLINPQADGTDDWVFGGFTVQLPASWSGSLGFVKLTLQTRDAGGNTVPEPEGAALALVAVVSAWLAGRRRQQA